MEFFKIRKDIPFMKYALVLNAISFVTFAAAVFFLVQWLRHPKNRRMMGRKVNITRADGHALGDDLLQFNQPIA